LFAVKNNFKELSPTFYSAVKLRHNTVPSFTTQMGLKQFGDIFFNNSLIKTSKADSAWAEGRL
jgi:hypothetical protein